MIRSSFLKIVRIFKFNMTGFFSIDLSLMRCSIFTDCLKRVIKFDQINKMFDKITISVLGLRGLVVIRK